MILEYIEHMRTKPRAARSRFAFMVAAGVTSLIALLWVFTLPAKFSSISAVTQQVESDRTDDVAALGEAVDTAKSGLQEIMNMGELMPSADPQVGSVAGEPIQGEVSPVDPAALQPFSLSESTDPDTTAEVLASEPAAAPSETPRPSAHSEEIVF